MTQRTRGASATSSRRSSKKAAGGSRRTGTTAEPPSTAQTRPSQTVRAAATQMRGTLMTTVLGHRVRVLDVGPRQTDALFIVNGSSANLEVLAPLVDILSRTRRVVAFDQPGMGKSPSTYPTLCVPTLAAMCERLATDLGLRQLDLLGYSFGGTVAEQLALTRPRLVRRLVLVAAVYGAGGIPTDPISSMTVLAHQTPIRPWARTLARRAYGGVVARDDDALTAYEEAINQAGPDPLSLLGQAIAVSTWSGLPWLWALRCPTLVIAGTDDSVVPLANAKLIAALIPRARLELLPHAGHLLVMDQAADVAGLVEAFLRQTFETGQANGSRRVRGR